MRISPLLAAGALTVFASAVHAQVQSVLFCVDDSISVYSPLAAYPSAGTLLDDEIGIVTPVPGSPYGAQPFLSLSTQWAFVGDHDVDGDFVESGTAAPGSDTDAILIKRLGPTPAQYGPRDVFLSKASDLAPLWLDGDVFRFSAQGAVEFFVTEAQLLGAIGQNPASDNIDVDAICMDGLGNLFLSFDSTELINGTSAEDGAIIHIPSTAITYDPNLNVGGIAAGSAVILANESDVAAMILASGVKSASGAVPSMTATAIELSALEIDPNGGVYVSPVDPLLMVPNLIFAWDYSENDGAILSTAGGGSIATINGVPMASAAATTALQLGLIPNASGTDGCTGLGLITPQPPLLVLENWPLHSYSSSSPLFNRQEVTGATAGGPVAFYFDVPIGSQFPTLTIPGFGGQYFGSGSPIVFAVATADANGKAASSISIPSYLIGTGAALVWQALDLATAKFAWPGATDF